LTTYTEEEKTKLVHLHTQAVLAERKAGYVRPVAAPDTRLLESSGGAQWAKTLYPHLFNRPFTQYQQDFWDWGWSVEADTRYRPRIECEPRGVGKSTNAEAWVVSLLARKKRKMVGYVSLTDEKATKHFEGIKSMLEADSLLKYYPHCQPKVQKLRSVTQQWSREAVVTDADAMVVPLTLMGSSRGWKSATGTRFDVIVLDDIDALGQSVDVTKKLIELLKSEILAAGDDQTVVLMPENLIYRDSICAQILDHRADILSDRIFCGPFPLLKWYDAVKEDIPNDPTGGKEWRITDGEAFDEAISIEYATKLLNTFGKKTFDRECQQKVFEVEEENDFREWNEVHHLVTHSEFRSVMEAHGEKVWNESRQRLQVPLRWNVGLGFDWGTTVGHPAVVSIVAKPSEHSPMKDCHFVIAEIVLPEFPGNSFETAELVSPGRMAIAVQQCLKEWSIQDSQIKMRLLSHEASATRNTLIMDLQDDIRQYWQKWQAKKGSGVPQIQNLLEIDHAKPHPFRILPEGYIQNGEDMSFRPLMGRPRMFFLVEDDQGELRTDASSNLYVLGPKNAKGFARARFEMPLYSHRNQGQNKIDDDFVDSFRGLMNVFGVPSTGFTREEKLLADIPAYMQEATDEQTMVKKQMWLQREMKERDDAERRRKGGMLGSGGNPIDAWKKASGGVRKGEW
jgi:hypothetical protein